MNIKFSVLCRGATASAQQLARAESESWSPAPRAKLKLSHAYSCIGYRENYFSIWSNPTEKSFKNSRFLIYSVWRMCLLLVISSKNYFECPGKPSNFDSDSVAHSFLSEIINPAYWFFPLQIGKSKKGIFIYSFINNLKFLSYINNFSLILYGIGFKLLSLSNSTISKWYGFTQSLFGIM